MIQALARLIGLTVLGQWLDRLPPLLSAWLRVVVVTLVFGVPVITTATGATTYSDLWWWLWIDACVVGIWAMVMIKARGESARFMFIHYFLMFTLLPGVLAVLSMFKDLPLSQRPWFLIAMGIASFIVHGWVTRRLWWKLPKNYRPDRTTKFNLFLANYLYPYLRLAVVYVGLFLPLAVPGIADGDTRPVDLEAATNMAILLAFIKLSLELVLALIHAIRVSRPPAPPKDPDWDWDWDSEDH